MSSFTQISSSSNKLDAIFEFQKSRPQPLLDMDHLVLAEKYLKMLNLSMGDEYGAKFFSDERYREAINNTQIFNGAAFNISKWLRDNNRPQDQTDIKTLARDLGTEFNDRTGGVPVFFRHNTNIVTSGGADTILICHGGSISKEKIDFDCAPNKNDIKDKFVSFLFEKGMITEKQIYDSNATLGVHHQRILAMTNNFSVK